MALRLRRSPDDSGAALVELGLILPIFFGILVGCVTAGLAFFARYQVTTAADEGARVMYVGGTRSEAEGAVIAAVNSPNPAGTHTVQITVNGVAVSGSWKCTDPGNSGAVVAVRVTRPNMAIQWLAGSTAVTVRGQAVTRCA